MGMATHTLARDRRSALYLADRQLFVGMLRIELSRLSHDARRQGLQPAIRLNGSSDIPWEHIAPQVFSQFSEIQFFDYTKVLSRMSWFVGIGTNQTPWPRNYHLTFSASATNRRDCRRILRAGGNVAVVFWPKVPSQYLQRRVIDGDQHDARFLDDPGLVVGLLAKGLARSDTSGFTIKACHDCELTKSVSEIPQIRGNALQQIGQTCRKCGLARRAHVSMHYATTKASTAA
jgi:hypothetical protein